MGKLIRLLLIFSGSAIGLILIGVFSGAVQLYTIPTAANSPNINRDQRIFITRFKKPAKGDFVAFVNPYSDTLMAFTNRSLVLQYVYRLCARENDVVEMQQSVLFVNGKNFDSGRNLSHYYLARKKDLSVLMAMDKTINADVYNDYRTGDSTTIVNIADHMVKQIPDSIILKKYHVPSDTSRYGIFMWDSGNPQGWTTDDFGPLTVPKGCCFVLGDNRSVALDSRYVGFIKMSNIRGVKL